MTILGSPALLVLLVGLFLLLASVLALLRLHRARRYGRLVRVDAGRARGPPLRSEAWRLSGSPDELRQLADGRIIPVEWKRGPAPRMGPPRSHRVQVAAYCLLVEETWGDSPPYGVLRYGDGVEFRVAWNRDALAELAETRRAVAGPYRGEATPSPGRCRACSFRPGCDARAA